jgi:hypothetical protein
MQSPPGLLVSEEVVPLSRRGLLRVDVLLPRFFLARDVGIRSR